MKKIWSTLLHPRVWLAKTLLALFSIAFLSLAYLGYLEPIQSVLDADELSFKVGNTRFSAYLLVKAALFIVILIWLTRLVTHFGEQQVRSIKGINTSNKALIVKAIQISVYFVAFFIALNIIGIDVTSLTIFSGAVGIGVGFGLQKIASNFISGLILLFEKSVEEDDLIELDDGTAGFVRSTGARYTLIETFESRDIMIPNEDFITNRVTNWTFRNTRGRIEINVGVAYGSDLDQVKEIILEAARNHPRCSLNPAPVCYLVEFGDSSVNFTLYFWVEDIVAGRMEPRSDVLFAIWHKFKEQDIEIPFPQRDIHMKDSGAQL